VHLLRICYEEKDGLGAAGGWTNLRYELSPRPKMANRSDLRQFVLFNFSRRRFFQNFRVFFGMSP